MLNDSALTVKGGEMAKDPVCGMDVEEGTAAGTATHEGKTYYFCSEQCKAAFQRTPARFVAASGA
jgi:Cu+-exporting ATPase